MAEEQENELGKQVGIKVGVFLLFTEWDVVLEAVRCADEELADKMSTQLS